RSSAAFPYTTLFRSCWRGTARHLLGLDGDFLFRMLCLRGLGQAKGQNALGETCLYFFGIHAFRHLERSLERTIAALRQIIVLVLFLLRLRLVTLDRKNPVVQLDIDIFLADARQFSRNFIFVVLLDDVEGGVDAPPPSRKRKIEIKTCLLRQSPTERPEILEKAIDLTPKAFEWCPVTL